MSARPVWTNAQDDALRDAGGVYAKMAALATEWGRSTRHVIARWHLLRVQERGHR